ncbi:flagellin [Oleispirillum naphthae]|uniref:flagellin n=1 Tax=Oleispirillum naphthae TaxID=2838853 RepID=UPI0030822C06
MANSITLSSATRTNLLSLQRTTDLIGQTQERLSTGKRVNSAIDDALSFFTSRNLNARASDLATIKSGIDEGIEVLTTTTDALTSVEDVLKQMKAIASSAKSTAATDTTTRNKLVSQFNELRSQIDNLVNDASYNGINLIRGSSNETTTKADNLTVKFSEDTTASPKREITINGESSDASSLNLNAASTGSSAWAITDGTHASVIDSAINEIDSALTTVRTTSQTFGINASLLQIRQEFTDNLINTLESGAANLVNADLNEESANMLALQTRQSLGTIALSIAQQSEQSILRLF